MHTKRNNLIIGKVLISFNSVDSTNEHARRLLSKNKPLEGTAIFAQHQVAGKGQYGKRWESETGKNLIFSVILYPHFLKPSQLFLLNKAIGSGLRNFVQAYIDRPVYIKWPNDIYVDDLKVAGILIENTLAQNKIADTIIGIGVNINQTGFHKDLPNPVSLKMLSGKSFDIVALMNDCFSYLESQYLYLKAGRLDQISKAYDDTLYGKGELRSFATGRDTFKGEIAGVTQTGQLQINVNGEMKAFSNNEIKMLLHN